MIILTTSENYPAVNNGLRIIADALTSRGQDVKCIPWQNDNLSLFCQATCVVPLCAWDYASHPTLFRAWVDAIQEGGGRLLNSPNVILQNMKKTYMLGLAKSGVHAIPTLYLENPSIESVREVQQRTKWKEMVLKPVYGQSGELVTLYSGDLTDEDTIFQCKEGVLIQPFIEQIKSQGELALCFIAGEFSHAVCRMPAVGEWRANSQYDVSINQVELPQTVIDQAALSLKQLNEVPLYARVDGVMVNNRFMLSELELIEPALYFDRISDLDNTGFHRFIQLLSSLE